MTIELKMPALSPTMEKGTLARWLVSVGDTVNQGDVLAEIETDKATMELEAADDGRIASLEVANGTENVLVGTVIAVLAQGDAAIAAGGSLHEMPVVSPDPVPASVPVHPAPAIERLRPFRADRSKVSPLAQRIADAKGLDLSGIVGTGPGGRIMRADLGLQQAPERSPEKIRPNATEPVFAPPPSGVPFEAIKLSSMRKTIARRLTESKQTVPHFYLSVHCPLDALLKLRGEINASLAKQGIKLSVNDFMIKALARAMVDEPDANVQFAGDRMYRFYRADVAMAVAIDGGLVTPVIQNCDRLSLSAIARQSQSLAAKARDGKLTPEEYQGGTASISNLGMYGIDEMFPVINPPQALILGIGAGLQRPWKVGGELGLATVATVTGSFDHRVIDGATGARFLAAFREAIAAPLTLIS
ncbi:dihydrolipoamide acetyltransferase family protein [Sphingobium sp. SA916]|uniref:dihydrolipoamide acetyltransferase family protein n=1 Tax=Sphingobium sp. SA916 TaxID=1851207 RepID=UPI000C9FFA27|nr:dihydrolipoamide acetyltransferase family protein [Sphingobium sp. SA916]PNQ03692.1 pyruvate dehydrogenase complex dihydrolipoamide acetyltransferase [Sphingobium sp. SA916]